MKSLNSARTLRITLFAGLILLILTGIVLSVFYIIERTSTKTARQEDHFYRILREYDSAISVFYGTEREYDHLHRELDRLEKSAISVESWLSILKRRNFLSRNHLRSLTLYRKSINNALSAYPFSEPITAIAAAALVKDSALTNEYEIQLRQWLPVFTDPAYNSLRLSLHVLLGDFKNPRTADAVTPDIISDGTESITVDLAILKILRGDYRAAADIQIMLETISNEKITEKNELTVKNLQYADSEEQLVLPRLSDDTLRFAAEYYYDFGDLLRSAEVFSFVNDASAAGRQADAMYLAGFIENAKSIWNILTQDGSQLRGAEKQKETAFYNLAALALDENDKTNAEIFLEKLNSIGVDLNTTDQILNSRQFGLILYSRLQELPRAISLLRNTNNLTPEKFPYIDLEINKRNSPEWNLARQIAETWLLLDRHPENEDLYKWAAWHLFFQRRYDEIPIFLDRLEMTRFSLEWVNLYKSIYLINDGKLQEAENILLSIPANEMLWLVHANLGRIYDEVRSLSRALIQYQNAVSLLQTKSSRYNDRTASRLQQRIARCYIAQNKQADAIRHLLNAIDIDHENISARHELDRLMY